MSTDNARNDNARNGSLVAIVAATSTFLAFAFGTIAKTGTAPERLDRLEAHAAETTARVVEVERRLLALERPDAAVYPPGHPGRIGHAPGVESSPNYLPRAIPPPSPPALRGRGAGGEGADRAAPDPPTAPAPADTLRDA